MYLSGTPIIWHSLGHVFVSRRAPLHPELALWLTTIETHSHEEPQEEHTGSEGEEVIGGRAGGRRRRRRKRRMKQRKQYKYNKKKKEKKNKNKTKEQEDNTIRI